MFIVGMSVLSAMPDAMRTVLHRSSPRLPGWGGVTVLPLHIALRTSEVDPFVALRRLQIPLPLHRVLRGGCSDSPPSHVVRPLRRPSNRPAWWVRGRCIPTSPPPETDGH